MRRIQPPFTDERFMIVERTIRIVWYAQILIMALMVIITGMNFGWYWASIGFSVSLAVPYVLVAVYVLSQHYRLIRRVLISAICVTVVTMVSIAMSIPLYIWVVFSFGPLLSLILTILSIMMARSAL